MAKTVQYVVIFDEGVRKRHQHELERGKVVAFTVQLEVLVEGAWHPVVRYDCAHGYAHRDRYGRRGQPTKEPLGLSFEHALTYSDWDINENWRRYADEFRQGTST